ncbi:MAG: pitrilysin family protein [Reichenbachiella sp.]|uniref:M16 family metallopeptidase n=1 Tax=Reichenbachiella sp. TaxID=2184521 RepID=UPI003266A7BF
MQYEKFTLDNGLQVVVHEDHSTKVAVLNVLYNVGSKDEDENKTGFAHLFEHLMFGGSANIPSYDEPLQKVGGENNAFTTPDYTNYYISVPSNNLETAFWLESDRMLSLAFDPESLEVQRKVVIEEFKQRYLDQPYGDAWLHMKPLAYKTHPYRWNTIGKEISHIENATMDDVKAFFRKFYLPNNAILVVAGDVKVAEIKELAKKWFGEIPGGADYVRDLPQEKAQLESQEKTIQGKVPMDAFYRAYHMPDRLDPNYHTIDLLSDIFGRGKSSRLYSSLVKDQNLLQSVSASITGSIDAGLLVISGKLKEGTSFDQVDLALDKEISRLLIDGLEKGELDKVKMKAESSHVFSEVELLNRAMSLAYYTLLGNTDLVNKEVDALQVVTETGLMEQAKKMLNKSNCSTLYYRRTE